MIESTIIGVGGAGLALARKAHEMLGIPCMAINTDRKQLEHLPPEQRLLIGPNICDGTGAASPNRGRKAAEESLEAIRSRLPDSGKIVFLAGLGGGAGTGAMPTLIKEITKRGQDLFVAVTLPFGLEAERREVALAALEELRATNITIITHDHAEHATGAMGMEEALENSAEAVARQVACWINGYADDY